MIQAEKSEDGVLSLLCLFWGGGPTAFVYTHLSESLLIYDTRIYVGSSNLSMAECA